jgi:hypothetical protein
MRLERRVVVFGIAAAGLWAIAPEPRAVSAESPVGLASRYPGDRGIGADPDVLFSEDFEAGSLEAVTKRWSDVSNKQGKPLALSPDVPAGGGKGHSLQVTATLGEDTGGHLFKGMLRGVDRMHARFYVKFPADAGYIHHFVWLGGLNPPASYPNPRAGERPRGDDRVSIGIEPTGDHGRYAPPGIWNFYNYWAEMKISADGRYWGNSILPEEPPLVVPKERWQCVEVMVKLNSAPEKADGELALWLDGRPAMEVRQGTLRAEWSGLGFKVLKRGGTPFEGFRWRTSDRLKLNSFWLEHYVTENAARANRVAAPNPVNRVWFDNVVVATSYIGPLKPTAP